MRFDETVLNWYDANRRALPWRETKDPYRIWLSEIMLQQTRVETVLGYYGRFLERFPDVDALAEADQDTVLKLWEGLGYYSRARNLHAAAKIISGSGGAFPRNAAELEKLPGIGRYAAGAIASIAYNECVPALDGNQMRILSRCYAIERILKTPFDLEDIAAECISASRPGDYNQALMDIGSAICTSKKPKCGICPLKERCRAYADGDPERYPLRPAPMVRREELRTVFVIETPEGILIRRRDEHALLGGLYEFPSAEGQLNAAEAGMALFDMGIGSIAEMNPLPDAKHVFTHLIWRMRGWHVRTDCMPPDLIAADADMLRGCAFPAALRIYFECAANILRKGDA